jgi:hypothetical protein
MKPIRIVKKIEPATSHNTAAGNWDPPETGLGVTAPAFHSHSSGSGKNRTEPIQPLTLPNQLLTRASIFRNSDNSGAASDTATEAASPTKGTDGAAADNVDVTAINDTANITNVSQRPETDRPASPTSHDAARHNMPPPSSCTGRIGCRLYPEPSQQPNRDSRVASTMTIATTRLEIIYTLFLVKNIRWS